MIEKEMVFNDMSIPGDDALYDIRIVAGIEFLNEDEEDDDNHMDFVSSVWDIKEIRLTDYTRKTITGMKTSWGIGFNLVEKKEIDRVKKFVSTFDFCEYVYDVLSQNAKYSLKMEGDEWL
jgi:hypothetical protein